MAEGFLSRMNRQSTLIQTNIRWLGQAIRLLDRLDDAMYAATAPGLDPHRAGAHLRHIIEFYQAFLNGVQSGRIDYDARRRDECVERSRSAAAAAIQSIIRTLDTCPALRSDSILSVRMEDAEGGGDCYMQSSISRELQVLSSHTIHHFALIAVTLRMHGVDMDPDFGMAPSTLRYLASKAAVAA